MKGGTCGENGGVKVNGEPCPVETGLSARTGLCMWHDPERAEKAAAARSKGGRVSQAKRRAPERDPVDIPPAPETIEDAKNLASWSTRAVLTGEIDARTADVVGRLLREFRSAVEKADLESEIRALRAEIRKGGRNGD